jgi:hypothetical protein
MALDTSIPLQAKAPDINPLATMLQVGQYKYLQQNSNKLQKDMDANEAVGQAIQRNTGPDGTVNLQGVQKDLAGNPAAAFNLQGATGTNLAQQGQQTLNGSNQLKLTDDQQAHMVQQLGTLLGKKDLTYADAVQTAAAAGQMYGLPAGVIQRSIANMPIEPEKLKPYIQARLAALQAPGAQLGTMTPNPTLTTDGSTNTYRDVNPVTNPGIVGTSFDSRLTPGQATGRMPTVGPNGQPGSIPFSDTVPPALLPPAMQGSAQPPAPGRYPQPQAAQGGFIPSGQAPGVAEAATAAGQGAGQELLTDQRANADSGKRINILQSASAALQNAKSGQGSQGLQTIKGTLVTLGLASQSQADAVKDYDEANKYLTQYAQQRAASFGHATDAQLSAALTGNGSTHISNLAAQDVVKVNMALERMDQARMQQWSQTGLAPDQYSKWKSQFGAVMDPRVFVADQMDIKKVGAMIQKMNPKERETFKTQYNWAVQNGYINGPQ